MIHEEVIIIGGGPCGLSAAIALGNEGIQALVIEKGNIVNSIYNYPTHQTFFSTSEKLEIGDVAFITENRKPVRNQALAYYREVVKRKQLRISSFENVTNVAKAEKGTFVVTTSKATYSAKAVIVATGYYDHPNYLNISGENLPHVSHYFKEGHPFFDKDVTVIGGKNSSIDAALELVKAGARVTVLYRGTEYSKSIKPWILPEFESLVRNGTITMVFGAHVDEITKEQVIYHTAERAETIKSDYVFAMTGYHPDYSFLKKMGIHIQEESGRPLFNEETMETNVTGIYIAGVIAAGDNANEIFIENGRFHGGMIATDIASKIY
ncbi:YpdA family putative bacillithiol disulfide reductase [Peribacillus huizhouensis]|uniref:Thioredoxin reductase (NADPH) n=1 Tax=Peribacillus huizhouensis TaxID=1501239 RepID=A0ABR6CQC7_9BACI|nr:YpdA family putative bacillithiol disulfide reductase [Peribacillus huizhouensis]MBA9027229.1 thioredoxin reductase (NADPH) [Peribacillus huizhouensis]